MSIHLIYTKMATGNDVVNLALCESGSAVDWAQLSQKTKKQERKERSWFTRDIDKHCVFPGLEQIVFDSLEESVVIPQVPSEFG